jgi:hypothetical protein
MSYFQLLTDLLVFSYLNTSSQVRAFSFPAQSQCVNAIPANHLKSFTVVTLTLFNLNSVEKTHVRYIHIYICMYVYGWFFDFVPTSGSGQFRVYKTSE